MIKIFNLGKLAFSKMKDELESEQWYDTLYSDGTPDCVCIELNENVIFKTWGEEHMIDFAGEKTFFYSDDYERIEII